MNKFSQWEDEEVKALFKFVEIKRSEGVPLIKTFKEFANCVNRQQNSVRNYYYKEIKELKQNNERLKRLGINLKNHIAKTPIPFTCEDAENIIDNIKVLISEGYSVRGACLKLANGDASLMVRYQNKYRAEVKYKRNEQMGNIIKMPVKKDVLSDEDVNALFLGLVRLVKRQEEARAKTMVENELNASNEKLKRAILDIANKQQQIEKLKAQISLLSRKVSELDEMSAIKNVKLAKSITTANQVLKQFVSRKKQFETALTRAE